MIHWRVRKALYFTLSAGSWFAIVWSNGNWAFVILFLGMLMAGLNVMRPDPVIKANLTRIRREAAESAEAWKSALDELEANTQDLEKSVAVVTTHSCADDEMRWNAAAQQYDWVCPHTETVVC